MFRQNPGETAQLAPIIWWNLTKRFLYDKIMKTKERRRVMMGRKYSDEELIYTDPQAGDRPRKHRRRGLRFFIAALIAAGLVLLAVAALVMIIQGARLPIF